MKKQKLKCTILTLTAALLLLTGCTKLDAPVGAAPAVTPEQTQTSPAEPAEPKTEQEPVAAAPAEEAKPKEPAAPERTLSYTMLLGGKEQTVYLDVDDGDILFWDSASGGSMVAAAKFPQQLPGAKEALKSCDFEDLDGDGNSELTAEFAFEDGKTASLVWFYVDAGFVYNEEFSVLPGEVGARGEE